MTMDLIVLEFQGYLRNISRYDSDIPTVIPDGIFGDETAESLKAFQRKHSLAETGTVNFPTWEKLIEENRNAIFFFSEPVQTAPISNEDLPLEEGKESHLNYNLNLMLSHLGRSYANFDVLELTSAFTPQTKAQVINFQKVIDREQTGRVDKETWNALSQLYLLLS